MKNNSQILKEYENAVDKSIDKVLTKNKKRFIENLEKSMENSKLEKTIDKVFKKNRKRLVKEMKKSLKESFREMKGKIT